MIILNYLFLSTCHTQTWMLAFLSLKTFKLKYNDTFKNICLNNMFTKIHNFNYDVLKIS